MSEYRIVCKWWTYKVYKRYFDGREYKIAEFITREGAEAFIEYDKEYDKERESDED